MKDKKTHVHIYALVVFAVIFFIVLFSVFNQEVEKPTIEEKNINLFLDAEEVKISKRHKNERRKKKLKTDGAKFKNEKVVMAMDAAKHRMDEIRRTAREILTNQKRAPDSRYNINISLSDVQSLDRKIKDTRPSICKTFNYDLGNLQEASVIIPFYNEALSMLLRTVHSILNRSPDSRLKEIILVDDCSTDEHLQGPLSMYLQLLPKVRMIRNDHRQGLIVSRMRGARLASGSVLIFMDAHSETNVGWLEPLLEELRINKRQVLQPFVDAIDASTLSIEAPGVYHVGTFSWDLRYTWMKLAHHEQMRAHDTGLPFATPTLVGCAIAVNKEYFSEIGNFDEGLKVWGGENIELGFRTWMCGGRVTTVTCSHVGHVFKEFPYTFDGNKEEIVQKNLIRVAETWMDGMRKYFYAATRVHEFKRAELNEEDVASLEKQKKLREDLKCQNFEWYMYNIIPQLNEPPMDALFHGEIVNSHSRRCWEVTEEYHVTLTNICYHHKIIPKNFFSLTRDGLLRYRDKCVRFNAVDPILRIDECPEDITNAIEHYGVWKLETGGDVSQGFLKVIKLNSDKVAVTWCIEQVTNTLQVHKGDQMPELSDCNNQNIFQRWFFTYTFDFSFVPKNSF